MSLVNIIIIYVVAGRLANVHMCSCIHSNFTLQTVVAGSSQTHCSVIYVFVRVRKRAREFTYVCVYVHIHRSVTIETAAAERARYSLKKSHALNQKSPAFSQKSPTFAPKNLLPR